MTLAEQCHSTWTALKRAKPRSTRSTYLQRELVKLQAKRMKQELKRGMKK